MRNYGQNRRPKKPLAKYVTLKNPLTGEEFSCIIVDEDTIEGVTFLVVNVNGRTVKLAKEAYTIVKRPTL